TTLGLFALAHGRRVSSVTRAGTPTYHCHYSTTIQCSSGDLIPAELRIYSPRDNFPVRDNTVAFVVAKLYIPPPGSGSTTALLEAYSLFPCPGDPSSDTYDDMLPDMPNPFVYGLGVVRGRWSLLPDNSKAFAVEVSDHIRDEKK
ncbi:hypothetical protein B0H21DRAFT_659508, partial [Amylocystis lapponica]